jgi:RHS repeat-associated protein
MQGMISVGHPVDVASGVFFTAAHDIVIPGVIPVVFRRCYSTGLLTRPEASALGAGWVHFFDMSLRRVADGFELFGHDGQRVLFRDGQPLNAAAQMELRREGTRLAVYHWHGWDGDIRAFLFDPPEQLGDVKRLAAIETPGGQGLRLKYDKSGRLISVRQSVEGRGIDLLYNPNGTIARILATSPLSEPVQQVEYAYSSGPVPRLMAAIGPTGDVQRYGYSNMGLMLEEVGHGGSAFHMRYDSSSRCVEVRGDGDYQVRRLSFDPERRVTRVADSLGHVTSYLANERGQIERIRYPDGGERTRVFDHEARIGEERDPAGITKRHEYDARGNRVATVSGETRNGWTFNDAHQVTACLANGQTTWTFAYERGRLTGITGPGGQSSQMIYDSDGVLIQTKDSAGTVVRIAHASDWSSETFEDDQGLLLRRTYDPWLRTLREDDAHGLAFEQQLDSAGRVIVKTEADGSATRFSWNASNDPSEIVNANGGIVRVEYTPYGQMRRFTDPNGLVYEFESDREGRMTAILNPKRERASFVYDSMGRVTGQTGFDGQTQSWKYDEGGRLIRRVKPGGVVLDFKLDAAGRLEQILSEDGRELAGWRFDDTGNIVEARTPASTIAVEWDEARRLIGETQNGRRVGYTRSSSGALEKLELEGGPGALSFERDSRGKLTAMRAGDEVEETFRYSTAGLLVERSLSRGQALEQTSYDLRRRIQGRRVVGPDQKTAFGQIFTYDRVSNLTGVRDSALGVTRHDYDPGKRLVKSTGGSGEREFLYDDCGNLVDQGGLEISYGPGGVLSRIGPERFRNDAAGRPVGSTDGRGHETSYTWDELDQLVEVKRSDATIRYAYDALGRRISKSVNGQETRFYWAGDHLFGEESAGSGTKIYWTPDLVPAFSWSTREGKRHFVTNPSDIPAATIDGDGRVVARISTTEFGGTISDGTVPFRLTGQYADPETGLHYNRHRYYHPLAGRFLTMDPIGFAGQWNLYQFAPNAIGFNDPFGLMCGNVGCPDHVVYALVNAAGRVDYVGITMQSPQTRCNQHTNDGKVFHHMEILANVGTAAGGGLTRAEARQLEGSSLYNVGAGLHAGGANAVNYGVPLLNAIRLDGNYYHSYNPLTNPNYVGAGVTAPVLNQNGIAQFF